MSENKYCIMPEQPYCPCCKFNVTDYGDAETYNDILGAHTNIHWVCTCSKSDVEEYYKNLWFCLCCYYHTATELYDRSLTDMRSPHDPTEAFCVGECHSASAVNAARTFNVVRHIANKYHIPKEIQSLGLCYGGELFSAQRWIENYNYLKQNGEMDFIEREIK